LSLLQLIPTPPGEIVGVRRPCHAW
jgi:hypothetical protein